MNATAAQRELADKAFYDYDFGDLVAAANGWRDEGDGELSQVFFLAADPNAESDREVFIVRFTPDGSAVAEAFVRG